MKKVIENKFVIYEDSWPSLGFSWQDEQDIERVDINKELQQENKDGWHAVQIKRFKKSFGICSGNREQQVFEVLFERTVRGRN